MLGPSQCMGSKKREGVTPGFAGPPLGLNGHEGDFRVTKYLVPMTDNRGQIWDGDLMLKSQDCGSEVVGEDGLGNLEIGQSLQIEALGEPGASSR